MARTNAKSSKKSKGILTNFDIAGKMVKTAVLSVIFAPCALGQTVETRTIEDNSFLIEEAYNQEERVVQHISNFAIFNPNAGSIQFSFTQEWPLFSHAHQLSYTLNYAGSGGIGAFGDVAVNYRYQLFDSDDWAAMAPRISLLLRTGTGISSSGTSQPGWQFGLPFSKRVSNYFTCHLNLGFELDPGYGSRTLTQTTVGCSTIWLASEHLNFFCELLCTSGQDVEETGEVTRSTEVILNPGFRASLDVESLQIVPGLGVPVTIGRDLTTAGVFFYLSFEHPF